MRLGHGVRLGLAFLSSVQLFAFPRTAGGQILEGDCSQCDVAIHRALRLLPEQPARVVVVDAQKAPPVLREHTEGFVMAGQDAVYLIRQGPTLQLAMRGPSISDYALAGIIWHEIAHIGGANEREAQRAEEDLWAQFIRQGRVDQTRGRRYLALLRKRQPSPETFTNDVAGWSNGSEVIGQSRLVDAAVVKRPGSTRCRQRRGPMRP